MKRILCLVWLFVVGLAAHAQAFGQIEKLQDLAIEYGDLRELRGERVFIHSENLAARARILREVAKYPRLRVVGRREDAQFILLFGSNLLESGTLNSSDYLGGDPRINHDSVDLIALVLINQPSPRTRICWVSTKQRANISTPQMLEMYAPGGGLKSQLIKLMIGSLLSSYPKLKSIPLNHPPEAKAMQEFIKALRKAQGDVR